MSFNYSQISRKSVEKDSKLLQKDCCTGYDHIPTPFIKLVAEFLISPMTFIFYNFIELNFQRYGKSIELVQFLK